MYIRTQRALAVGVSETEEESDALKKPLVDLLKSRKIFFKEMLGNEECYEKIANEVIDLVGVFNKVT